MSHFANGASFLFPILTGWLAKKMNQHQIAKVHRTKGVKPYFPLVNFFHSH